MRISDWSSDVCSSDLMKVDGQVSLVYYQYNAPRRPPMRLAFLVPPMLLLAACGQKDENDRSAGTDISINADGEGGGDRKSVGQGKSVSVRVDLGGRRIIKKKHRTYTNK